MRIPRQTQYPLGENVWVRRDHPDHAVLFFFREFAVSILIIIFFTSAIWSNYKTAQALFHSDVFSLTSSAFMYIFLTLGYILLAVFVLLRARSVAVCPIIFYSEQLDPAQLVIHKVIKKTVVIPLQHSYVDSKKQLHFYNKITIRNQDVQQQATLEMLTPEEHDRFMAYWNAANPPS